MTVYDPRVVISPHGIFYRCGFLFLIFFYFRRLIAEVTERTKNITGRKRERYKIEPRISVPFMLEMEYESKIIKNY